MVEAYSLGRTLLVDEATQSRTSDDGVTIKGMPTTPHVTASAEGALLSRLTRSELGDAFAAAVRTARAAETRSSRRRNPLGWLQHPAVLAVRAEYRRRHEADELDGYAYREAAHVLGY